MKTRTFFALLLLGLTFQDVCCKMCPPLCSPPPQITSCDAYIKVSKCKQDEKDISTSQADCACSWLSYIQSIEPATGTIFTKEGSQCYIWAASVCSYQESKVLYRNLRPLQDFLGKLKNLTNQEETILSEEVKSRKRDGVNPEDIELKERRTIKFSKKLGKKWERQHRMSTRVTTTKATPSLVDINQPLPGENNFIGKTWESEGSEWVEIRPTVESHKSKQTVLPDFNNQQYEDENDDEEEDEYEYDEGRRHRRKHLHLHLHYRPFDVDMDDDQFKLAVFLFILLVNVVVVLALIICRTKNKSKGKEKEALPKGDLDPNAYKGKPSSPPSPEKSPKKSIFSKLKKKIQDTKEKKKQQKKKKKNPSFTFFGVDELDPKNFHFTTDKFVEENSELPQPKRHSSRGLYDNEFDDVEEQEDVLYEQPVSLPPLIRDFHPRRYSLNADSVSEGEDTSPTKYFPRQEDEHNRSVTFQLPPSPFVSMQDTTRSHAGRKSRNVGGGGTTQFQMVADGGH